MIPKDVIDRIYSTARIEEVVGDYTSLKRRGSSLWSCCPFPGHTEKTPSFCVTPARNICKCFGCGKGGNAVNFIMAMEQCTYPEALEKIAAKYHIEIPKHEMTDEEKQHEDDRESMFIVNDWANHWYQDQLWNTEEGQAIGLSYFRQRGLRDETIRRFQLGYSPEKAWLLPQAAKQAGYLEKYLVNDPDTGVGTGICGRSSGKDKEGHSLQQRLYDRYHGRVMFPLFGISGKTVSFAGRILEKRDDVGKYVNSPESIVFSKKQQLYGFYQAKQSIAKKQKCYLVEGQMDCISMSQAGVENVVCSGGTALTREQIALIHRFTNDVTILYDGDAAGIHAALRGIDMFLAEGLFVKVMLFPDGDDPDSFARKHTADEFIDYINTHEEDFIDYMARTLLQTARDARQRSEAIHAVANSISLIDDRITRDLYVKDCARLMGMEEKTILTSVNNLRLRRRDARDAEEARKASASVATGEQPGGTPGGTPGAQPGEQTDNAPVIGVDEEPDDQTPTAVQPTSLLPPGMQTAIHQNYMNLLRGLIRYGEQQIVFLQDNGATYTVRVGDYMQQYIRATQLPIDDPIVQRFFDEYEAYKEMPDFRAETFFTQHPDPEVSALASDLLSERQVLSSFYAQQETDAQGQPIPLSPERMRNLMMQLLYELHLSVVSAQIEEIGLQVNAAILRGDDAAWQEANDRQNQLTTLRRNISDLLGKN